MKRQNRKWYKWPQGYIDNIVPWYVALRRLIFWPLLVTGMCITFVAVLGGFGIYEAKRTWRNI